MVVLRLTFLLQIFSHLCLCRQDIIKIIRLLLAAMSIIDYWFVLYMAGGIAACGVFFSLLFSTIVLHEAFYWWKVKD